MKTITSFSFDFWDLIAKPNDVMIHDLNHILSLLLGTSVMRINEAFVETSLDVRSFDDKCPNDFWSRFLEYAESPKSYLEAVQIQAMGAFLRNPFTLHESNVGLLRNLVATGQVIVSIIEKTTFVPGNLIQEMLRLKGVDYKKIRMVWTDYEDMGWSPKLFEKAHCVKTDTLGMHFQRSLCPAKDTDLPHDLIRVKVDHPDNLIYLGIEELNKYVIVD